LRCAGLRRCRCADFVFKRSDILFRIGHEAQGFMAADVSIAQLLLGQFLSTIGKWDM
jgi:hypothetical protein